ncbi:NUDIX hydrolase [Actibacterium sp. 188UL27-1]|uniref:NUDIX hydrolase n=1 Tax=Actibacterium sp. 188UL27-1 TaxID=2786961 RepID=UPI00195A2620|nr:NUDIX hydrolase [Actibacterium sp. 188UL27-1]MBM7066905.1 NUDIX hydrolase [Actibacterium sp. 188UL27-1]
MLGKSAVNLYRVAQTPITVTKGGKRDIRTQFGAICYRLVQGKPQILLVTSRTRKRWIIPKGWPADGLTPAQAASQEAWEEGGVKGKSHGLCLGIYGYVKELGPSDTLPCIVAVYPLRVKTMSDTYPESGQRRRKWFSQRKAARKVDSPELREIIDHFDPRFLR